MSEISKSQEFRNKRIAAGLCPTCGESVKDEFVQCPECRRWAQNKRREIRNSRRDAGVCMQCGKVVVTDGYSNCPDCRAYNSTAKKRSREKRRENNETRQFV